MCLSKLCFEGIVSEQVMLEPGQIPLVYVRDGSAEAILGAASVSLVEVPGQACHRFHLQITGTCQPVLAPST